MASGFTPRQVTPYDAAALDELQGDVSETIIRDSLKLIPPIPRTATVHDNGCGSGAVFTTILTSSPPEDMHIDATDINAQFVAGCDALAKRKNWPVTATVMSAQEISFPDDRIDLSFTNLVFHCVGDSVAVAKNIYRTLKPGGKAISSVWVDMPHVDALHKAHYATRGREGPMPTLLPEDHYEEKDLRQALESGGFEGSKISFYTREALFEITDLRRWAQLAWSYLGPLPTGWSKSDENKWEEAIEIIVESLRSGRGITTNDKGTQVLKMVACVAIATK